MLTIAHEIGHILGLRRSNWEVDPNYVPGAGANYFPVITTEEPSSIMRYDIGVLGWSWTGFSANDIVAANYLYPVESVVAYDNAILGPTVVPAVGNLTHDCAAPYSAWFTTGVYSI